MCVLDTVNGLIQVWCYLPLCQPDECSTTSLRCPLRNRPLRYVTWSSYGGRGVPETAAPPQLPCSVVRCRTRKM